MANIEIKRGTVRAVRSRLLDGDGAAANLTGATSIRFQMRTSAGIALKVDRVAVVVDAPTATVEATLTATDTDTKGNYRAEWRVTYAGGDRIFPEENYLTVKVWEDLAP